MDFSYTDEQEEFRKSVREFCSRKIAPRVSEIDSAEEIPRDILKDMAEFGLLGITISKEYGGKGANFQTAAIAAEEIARADISMATAVYYLVEAGWGYIFEKYGTKEAREEFLPSVTNGDHFLGIASTESTGGSDIASTSTVMEKKNEKFVLNGAKTYISGVREAEQYGGGYVTVVKTEKGLGHKGLSLCYLPVKDMEGVATKTIEQMGREGMSNGIITMKNANIPLHYLIGERNNGFYYAMEGFNLARTLVAAACVGAAEKVLETGVKYLKERPVFGSPIGMFQGLQFQLAENYIKLESAKLLVNRAAWLLDTEMYSYQELNKAVAAAKFAGPTAAFDIIKEVMMWHGAYGYTRKAGLERGLRGVASYIVGAEGAQNIMRLIIARELLGKDFIK